MKTSILISFLLFTLSLLYSTIINVPADQPTIQAGIDVAVNTDTVLVQPGTYYENINYNGKNITVASMFLTTQDTIYITQTIIDGDSLDTVVKFEGGEDHTAVLTGFTLTNGNSGEGVGGGIICLFSNPTLENLKVSENVGGGIACTESNPSLQNVIISNNSISVIPGGCGGIHCYSNSNPSLQNVTITGNNGGWFGGGISCSNNSSPIMENVTITDNYSMAGGGIFCLYNSDPTLTNVTITDNSAGLGGGMYCKSYSNPSLVNVSITGCYADIGGGMYCRNNSNPELINSILWNDSQQEIYFPDYSDPNSITISYSDIQGGEAGIVTNNNGTVNWLEGNINSDPLFVGTGNHPFMLHDLSPCVNAGNPDSTGLNLPEYDLAGNPRIYGERIDMGAYENQNVIVNTEENIIPLATKLNQNYPNPFNPTTTIEFSIDQNEQYELSIYNLKGQKVKSFDSAQDDSDGYYSVIWNGTDDSGKSVSSGIYFYKLKTDNFEQSKKMILMK